jgi:DNA-binding response OmpR family regulator
MGTILLVENDSSQRLLYSLELEREGHEVLAVAEAEEALRILDESPVDLVVLDLVLPDTGGLELLQKMVDRHRDLKVIIYTAHPDFKVDFRSWGAERYLTKGSDVSVLTAAVSDLLRGDSVKVEQD